MDNLDKIKNKKYFFSFLGLYILGFIVLMTIGEKINQNGYLITALLAPVFIALAIIGISYTLYKNKE